jgi:hypothetical protein
MSLSAYDFVPSMQDTDFVIGKDNFGDLSINPMLSSECYWFRNGKKSLVKRFVLKKLPRVEKSCIVTLAKNKDGTYSPRFDFRIYDISKKSFEEYSSDNLDLSKIKVKAKVDISDCQEEFSALLNYMMNLDDIALDKSIYRTVDGDYLTSLEEALKNVSKEEALYRIGAQYEGKITEDDVEMLLNRKSKLEIFNRLLNDKDYFERTRLSLGENNGPESVWQDYFERNQWIFGYGLKLVACESLDDDKLEQISTGANIFTGSGKRADALLRSRGYISSLLFCEIKTDTKPLLAPTQYRKPDVYRVSSELSGGVSQVQKTTHKALRTIASEFHRLFEPDGTPLRVEISSIKPRQVLIIGNLSELLDGGEINLEKSLSFELYRKSIIDVEILTFDELYQRAAFIVNG